MQFNNNIANTFALIMKFVYVTKNLMQNINSSEAKFDDLGYICYIFIVKIEWPKLCSC